MTAPVPRRAANPRALLNFGAFAEAAYAVRSSTPDIDGAAAAHIVEEALKFVAACAKFPDEHLLPSRAVAEGWRALTLQPDTYDALCKRLGRFVPRLPDPPDVSRLNSQVLERAQEAIRRAGYAPDPTLWDPPTDVGTP